MSPFVFVLYRMVKMFYSHLHEQDTQNTSSFEKEISQYKGEFKCPSFVCIQ